MKNTAYRHVNLLSRKKTLLLKAKTLYFIEVDSSLGRKNKNKITISKIKALN
jgi:hypothetical protein